MKYIILTLLLISCLSAQTDRWRLVWDENPTEDNVIEYLVFRDTQPGASIQIAGTPDTTYIDSDLQPGTLYYYRLKARNAAGESDFSIEVSAAIPSLQLPDSIGLTGQDQITIDLSNYVVDPDNTSWTFIYHDNVDLLISVSGNLATITKPPGWSGSETIRFRAIDDDEFFGESEVAFWALGEPGNPAGLQSPLSEQSPYSW